MKSLGLVSLLCAVSVVHSVVTFNAYDGLERDTHEVVRMLMRGRTAEWYMSKSRKYQSTRLKTFVVKNCADPKKESAILVNLKVTPDPIRLPGEIGVGFTLDNYKLIQSPLVADVKIQKRIFHRWITVPCIDDVGSCHYDDFCGRLNAAGQCPDPFTKAGVPCKCPFNVGNYTLSMSQFKVDTSVLPAGDYFGQINLTMNGALVTCVQVYATIA